jgi:microcystin-dependent protein
LTLTSATMPAHTHTVNCDPNPRTAAATPASNVPAGAGTLKPYVPAPDTATMNAAMIQPVGGGQSHENRQPFQCLNVFICVEGDWPPRP